MADVFISYKREDASRVEKLVAALRAHGLDTWWDKDIPPSAPWEATIERELNRAKAVIVCWSPDAVASDNVRSEARVAREDGRLIQLFVRPCQPPLFFGEKQGLDLSRWRGKADDPRLARLAETIRTIAAGERREGGSKAKAYRWFDHKVHAALAMIILLIGSGAGWWLLSPGRAQGPMTLAVLPFRALNPADANLVDAIWDDTRGAISRNRNLRVLGRETVDALVGKHLEPSEYKSRAGADYLLDGTVEHIRDQVHVKLSLVRTTDGVEVWSDELGGKLDDVFAFQQHIASEVEGRIRGRVAPEGGVTARNISTSGEVYSIYAEARSKIRLRGPETRQAIPLLKQAVAMDPNYAPAWADLAQVIKMRGEGTLDEVNAEANADVSRALILAPNLAHAYAVRAFIEGLTPQSEPGLRKAVALDPNDPEAWMWLGNCLDVQNRLKEALAAHSRAVEIEPLWFNSMYNKMDDLARLDDRQGLTSEVARAEDTGDPYLVLRAREHAALLTGRIGDAMQNELEVRRRFPDQARKFDAAEFLMQLGYIDETAALLEMPPTEAAPYKGIPLQPEALRKRYPSPLDFWNDDETPLLYSRLLAKSGRLGEFANWYKAAFRSVDEYHSAMAWAGSWHRFAGQAPDVAVNLRSAGEAALAQQVIDKDEATIEPLLRNGPANWDLGWNLAELRSAEGRDDEAVAALNRVVSQGWLPNGTDFAIDIAEEPCFQHLAKRRDFEAIRQRILRQLANERRKVTPAMLASTGIAHKTQA